MLFGADRLLWLQTWNSQREEPETDFEGVGAVARVRIIEERMVHNGQFCVTLSKKYQTFFSDEPKLDFSSSSRATLISLITVEVGINVEGVQKLQNQ